MLKLNPDHTLEKLTEYGFIEDAANVEPGDHYYSTNNHYLTDEGGRFRLVVNHLEGKVELLHRGNDGLDSFEHLDTLATLISDSVFVWVADE